MEKSFIFLEKELVKTCIDFYSFQLWSAEINGEKTERIQEHTTEKTHKRELNEKKGAKWEKGLQSSPQSV